MDSPISVLVRHFVGIEKLSNPSSPAAHIPLWDRKAIMPSILGGKVSPLKSLHTSTLQSYCSLPLWRVHGINRMYLASRTHGLFITWTQFRLLTTFNIQTIIMYIYTEWQHNHGAIPLFLLPLADSFFTSLPFPFTYLETLLGVIGSCSPWSQVTRKLTSPFSTPPHSKFPVTQVNCAPYYDDIVIPASHGPEQLWYRWQQYLGQTLHLSENMFSLMEAVIVLFEYILQVKQQNIDLWWTRNCNLWFCYTVLYTNSIFIFPQLAFSAVTRIADPLIFLRIRIQLFLCDVYPNYCISKKSKALNQNDSVTPCIVFFSIGTGTGTE